jgi:hypothetical protein
MIVRLPEYKGARCDITGAPMERPMGHFARGATGRMHIWALRENAIKHAMIEDEMKETGVL